MCFPSLTLLCLSKEPAVLSLICGMKEAGAKASGSLEVLLSLLVVRVQSAC